MIRIILKLLITVVCFLFYIAAMFILLVVSGLGFKEWTCEWTMIFLKFWNINDGDVIKYRDK